MATTWTAPDVMDALQARWQARPGLAGVTVATVPLGDDTPADEYVVLTGADGAQAFAAIGRGSREETYDVVCVIHAERRGAGETVARAARDRAMALLAEIAADLAADPAVGPARTVEVGQLTLEQGGGTETRWAHVTVRVRVRARVTPA